MKIIVFLYCSLALMTAPLAFADSTTIYLVRHTEKDLNTKNDPALTNQGQLRARQLADFLQYQSVDAVYSTNTLRTRDTAKPIALANNVDVRLYEVGELAEADLAKRHNNQAIVIVGHSNTIPRLVNKLVDENRYSDLDETDYDSFFIVDLTDTVKTSKRLYIPLVTPPKNLAEE